MALQTCLISYQGRPRNVQMTMTKTSSCMHLPATYTVRILHHSTNLTRSAPKTKQGNSGSRPFWSNCTVAAHMWLFLSSATARSCNVLEGGRMLYMQTTFKTSQARNVTSVTTSIKNKDKYANMRQLPCSLITMHTLLTTITKTVIDVSFW